MSKKSQIELVSKRHPVRVLVGEVKAAMLFASTEDSRYVLNGVCFEARPGKPPLLVATDGRRLAVIETQASQVEDYVDIPTTFIVATAFLKPLVAFAKSQACTIEVDYHPPTRIVFTMVEGKCAVDSEKGAIVEGDFPNWQKVLPAGEKEAVKELGINAELVADFGKASKLLGSKDLGIRMNLFNKDGVIEVHINGKPNFYGVVMPMKSTEDVKQWQPGFVTLATPLKAA